MSETTLDALSRGENATPTKRMPSWLVPLALLAGFTLVFLLIFRDRLLPAQGVEVQRVVALAAQAGAPDRQPRASGGGAMLFQASGWIEPDPYTVKATALTDGVIDEVRVLEGQLVSRGDVLATLIDDDAGLALQKAERGLDSLRSAREAHCAGIERTVEEMQTKQAEEQSTRSLLDEARDQVARFEKLRAGVVSERDKVEAAFAIKRLDAQVIAAHGRVMELKAELPKLAFETTSMEHRIAAEEVKVAEAKLALERTVITAPIDGRVLRLFAVPGQKRMLAMDDPDSSTVALLYDPQKLQVRVDVPLADAAGLRVGQPAKIRCNLLPDRVFTGRVTRIVGEADLQRNTLQAKVEIHEPIDGMRPEMLCRVEFLDGGSGGPAGQPAAASVAVWMPESAAGGDGIWVYDPENKRVENRPVRLSEEKRDGRVRVDDGLRPGEWVVVSPTDLRDGQRVNPKEVTR